MDTLVKLLLLSVAAITPLIYAPFFTDYMVPKAALAYLVLPAALALLLCRAAWFRSPLPSGVASLRAPLVAYALVMLWAWAGAYNRAQGLEAVLAQFGFVGTMLLGAWAATLWRRFGWSLAWIAACVGFGVAVLGVLQFGGIHLIPLPRPYGNLPVSTLGNPNFVAHFLELVIPLQIGLLWTRRSLGGRLFLVFALVVSCCHLILTQSRGGWLALAVALAIMGVLLLRGRPWRSRLILLVVLGALLSPAVELVLDSVRVGSGGSLLTELGTLAEATLDRALSVFQRTDFSISQRRIVWGDTLSLIRAYPWTGVGPGNYELFVPAYRNVVRQRQWRAIMGDRDEVAYHAHNDYLEIAAETGVFGLAAFVWLLLAVLRAALLAIARQPSAAPERVLAVSLLGALGATLVHCLFSFNLQDPAAAIYFWLFAGVLLAMSSAPPGTAVQGKQPGSEGHRVWVRAMAGVLAVGITMVGVSTGVRLLVADGFYFRALREQHLGHPNRAALAAQRALVWRDHDFRYYQILGVAHVRAGRLAEARAALRRSVQLHPNNVGALRLLGETADALHDPQTAVTLLERALRLDRLALKTYEVLAIARREAGDHQGAVQTWKQALAFTPEDAGLLNSLGVEYAQAGQPRAALHVLEQAGRLHPDDVQIKGNLGSMYLAVGEGARGESYLLQALARAPENLGWRLRLAKYYAETARPARADSQLQAILEQDPDNAAAQQLAWRVRQAQEAKK